LPFRCCLLFSAIWASFFVFAFKFTSRIFYIVHASVKWFTLISRVVTFSCPKLVFFTKSKNIDDWTLEFSKEIVVSLLLTVGHKIHTSSPLRLVGAKWLDEASVERDAWTPPPSPKFPCSSFPWRDFSFVSVTASYDERIERKYLGFILCRQCL
jgi:hypothetical protein